MSVGQDHAVITVGDYYIARFPQALPDLPCYSTSSAFLGTPDISDEIDHVLDIDMGSDARWIADPATLVDAGGGNWDWQVSAHSSGYADTTWRFPVANLPVIDPTYDYKRADGRTLIRPAMVFSGDQWGKLHAWPTDPADEVTVAIVARLRRTNGAHRAGVIESRRGGTDTEASSDVYLRFRGHDYVRIGVANHHHDHVTRNTRRPHIISAAHGAKNSRLVFVDKHRHAYDFNHPSVDAYDMSWYLGRLGGTYDEDQTIVMDLLEVNIWQSKLNHQQLRHAVHKLTALYKVSG